MLRNPQRYQHLARSVRIRSSVGFITRHRSIAFVANRRRCFHRFDVRGCSTQYNDPLRIDHSSDTIGNRLLDGVQFYSEYPYTPCTHRSIHQHLQYRRASSSTTTQRSRPPSTTLEALEFRVNDLECLTETRRLSKHDLQHEIWPLLADCAASHSLRYQIRPVDERIAKAQLSNRLLELCLREVEGYRAHLWEWMKNADENINKNTDDGNDNKFSPTTFWKDAPHPTKEMYNLVISSWKNVVETCSVSPIKPLDAIELMENAARQASSLLAVMEDEYSSDVAFVDAYNSHIDTGKFATIRSGAAFPDVRNYGEVMSAWGQCVNGIVFRHSAKRDRGSKYRDSRVVDGTLQKRLRLEASAMKSMMELIESMEEDLYGAFNTNDDATQLERRKRPAPDRVCYNILLSSMARQTNPSLYEMRLVLQRMMERVQYEMEHADEAEMEAGSCDDQFEIDPNSHALSFFPDAFSYNALIEARANRSAMFASDKVNMKQRHHINPFQPLQTPEHHWQREIEDGNPQQKRQVNEQWKHWNEVDHAQPRSSHSPARKRFSASEEEALLAEQTLEEMCHLVTISVRPNIYSYNCEFVHCVFAANYESVSHLG